YFDVVRTADRGGHGRKTAAGSFQQAGRGRDNPELGNGRRRVRNASTRSPFGSGSFARLAPTIRRTRLHRKAGCRCRESSREGRTKRPLSPGAVTPGRETPRR